MYSRCPHCNKQIQVSARQLRVSRGLLKCKRCGDSFDALALLSEKADQTQAKSQSYAVSSFKRTETGQSPWLWGFSSLMMFMALLAQIGYFEGQRLYGRPTINLALAKACQVLDCRLPDVNNPEDWVVSHSELQAHLDNRYWLIAALTNQAAIKQVFPELKLTLTDFNGQPFAERVFTPYQYSKDKTLAANETVLIRLPLVMAVGEFGGFSLDTL